MPQRRSVLLFPVFALVFAVGGISTTRSARAADECVTKPNGSAPQGQHWYYRRDEATQRQCWFLTAQNVRPQKNTVNGTKRRPSDAPPPPPTQPAPNLNAPARPSPGPVMTGAGPSTPDSAILLRWPEAARYPDAPSSFAPTPTVTIAEARRPDPIGPALSSNGKPAEEPQWSATTRPPERADPPGKTTASAEQDNRVFALIMTTLALLAIAGAVSHAGRWPRRPATSERKGVAWLRHSPSNPPLAATKAILDGEAAAEPFDWSQQFAQAWQQISEQGETRRPCNISSPKSQAERTHQLRDRPGRDHAQPLPQRRTSTGRNADAGSDTSTSNWTPLPASP